ncbi:MAG TPA: DUF169 domain-containing protein [Candidatus Binatia bacterium]|nr:DUF169 domain-containing protein [Candidatus Binatia bacterium]
MTDYPNLERRLSEPLGLDRRPVAVAFRDAPPAGVPRFPGQEPSGCSFWRLAAEGRTFYTVPADHHGCPVGSHTHGFALPEEPARRLGETLALMTEVGYLRSEEVEGIPRLSPAPAVVVYAPLGDTPVDPDVVLLAGRPGRLMLLGEAAARAGVAVEAPLLGRPTCMALPVALARGVVGSLGCIGNRVYTGLGEDDLYLVVPGRALAAIADALATVTAANRALEAHHRDRRRAGGAAA